MSTPVDLSLVVPCFQEGARVDRCAEALWAWSRARPGRSVEVVAVDDGSPDDTAARWEAWQRRWGQVRLVRREHNGGKGAALRDGVAASRGRLVAYMDCDLAVPVEHLDALLARLDAGADLVVGSRSIAGARVEHPQPRLRRWMGRTYLRLARRALGLGVSDITCGFKALRGDLARGLLARTRCDRWGIDAELLALAVRGGARVHEIPVVWRAGSRTSVRLVRDALRSGFELWSTRNRLRRTSA